jgi:hypothetical protein
MRDCQGNIILYYIILYIYINIILNGQKQGHMRDFQGNIILYILYYIIYIYQQTRTRTHERSSSYCSYILTFVLHSCKLQAGRLMCLGQEHTRDVSDVLFVYFDICFRLLQTASR